MHSAPRKLQFRSKVSKHDGGYLTLIKCTAMLQFYQFQAECAFTQPSSSALEQMDYQRRCLNDVLEMSSTYFFIVLICIWIIVCFYFFIDQDSFRGEPPIPEVLSRPHPDFKCSAASFNTPSWIFLCFFSTLWPKSLLASKKIKYVSFLFEVIRFAACFRRVDHIGENHISAQFQISPMLCIPKFFFLRAGINFNTIFSYFGRFPN